MTRNIALNSLLIKKYNKPVPRYTSYPTVPFWKDEISIELWKTYFTERFTKENAVNGISLYIHLPFCESLCSYCGCNKKITTNHSVEEEYLRAIEKEWKLYRRLMGETPVLREIHLGGGTPTFFSPRNLKRLLNIVTKNSVVHPYYEFSIEGHPNNTSREQLDTLFSLGFRRISYGVQDLDSTVQKVINRIQPFENVERATDFARAAGFSSINFDLIYGLPLQTLQSIEDTITQVITLRPERIAFYSYAHTPWTSRGQRLYNENDIPKAEQKLQLYLKGRELLMANGYYDIGMDHFALPTDELYIGKQNGGLQRNFMGYKTQNRGMLVGLGVSAISDLGKAFAQNNKTLHNYYSLVQEDKFPVKRGFFLNKEDIAFGQYINNISCTGYTEFNPIHLPLLKEFCFSSLAQLAADGLVVYNDKHLSVTQTGHYFIRNICSAFDLYLQRNAGLQLQQSFSKAI